MSSEHSPARQRRHGIGHNGGPPLTTDDVKVLSLKDWAKLNGFSLMTGKRLIKRGEGPTTIRLSPRRVGVRMVDNARWQASRLRE